ncbi:MAG: IgGFc-binding protein [Polyangiaceae bacterium]|nr:IgGFc-binding protein [Polyangiaceae bacterium]
MPVTYSLNAGQFLQITQIDELTGSPLESDKPVGVFGASTCMQVPTTQTDCDSAQQQLPPVGALGNEYVAVRHKSRAVGMEEPARWRMVGVVDGTTLTWAPSKPPNAPTSIGLGEVVEFEDPGPFVVRAQDRARRSRRSVCPTRILRALGSSRSTRSKFRLRRSDAESGCALWAFPQRARFTLGSRLLRRFDATGCTT